MEDGAKFKVVVSAETEPMRVVSLEQDRDGAVVRIDGVSVFGLWNNGEAIVCKGKIQEAGFEIVERL